MNESFVKEPWNMEGGSLGSIETKLQNDWYYKRHELLESRLPEIPEDQLNTVKGYINLLREEYDIVSILSKDENFVSLDEYYRTRERIPIEGKDEDHQEKISDFFLVPEDARLAEVQYEIKRTCATNDYVKKLEDIMWKEKQRPFDNSLMSIENRTN